MKNIIISVINTVSTFPIRKQSCIVEREGLGGKNKISLLSVSDWVTWTGTQYVSPTLKWVCLSFPGLQGDQTSQSYRKSTLNIHWSTDAEAPIIWPPDVKSQLIGKDPDAGEDWRQEEKGKTENEMVWWYHRLDGHEFEQVLGLVMDREAWCAVVHGVTKSQKGLSNWTELCARYMLGVTAKMKNLNIVLKDDTCTIMTYHKIQTKT